MSPRVHTLAAPLLFATGAALGVSCAPAPLVMATLTVSAPRSPQPTPATPAPTKLAPVVVTVVVDQLAAWVAADRLPQLPADGGFARLLKDGTYAREVHLPHAVTDTAPGHATLYTGAPPRTSGIAVNERLEPSGDKVSVYRDAAARVVGPTGPAEATSSSAAALRVPTVADMLREQHPNANIVTASVKDRGAIPGGGKRPTLALWFEPARDELITSTAFASALPEWARPSSSREAIVAARAQPWTPLDAGWLAAHAATPDDQPGEGEWPGLGHVFPHDLSRAKHPAKAMRGTPFADAIVFAVAEAAVQALELGKEPTLLALSLSANDYVGHVFGPDSWEAWDTLRRVDAGLAHLFAALDAKVGAEGWSAVLTADHGIAPLPETMTVKGARPWCDGGKPDRFERPCVQGGRLVLEPLEQELRRAAAAKLGKGEWVLGVADPYVWLTPAAKALPAARYETLLATLTQVLERRPEVAKVYDVRKIPQECPPVADESPDALVCRAYLEGHGELYVVPKLGSFFDPDYTPGRGVSHGTPFLYDRTIPVLARGPGKVAAGLVIDEPQMSSTFARTVAALLGVPPPAAATQGRALTEAR